MSHARGKGFAGWCGSILMVLMAQGCASAVQPTHILGPRPLETTLSITWMMSTPHRPFKISFQPDGVIHLASPDGTLGLDVGRWVGSECITLWSQYSSTKTEVPSQALDKPKDLTFCMQKGGQITQVIQGKHKRVQTPLFEPDKGFIETNQGRVILRHDHDGYMVWQNEEGSFVHLLQMHSSSELMTRRLYLLLFAQWHMMLQGWPAQD